MDASLQSHRRALNSSILRLLAVLFAGPRCLRAEEASAVISCAHTFLSYSQSRGADSSVLDFNCPPN